MKAKISKKMLEAVIRAAVRGTVSNAKAHDSEVGTYELSNIVWEIGNDFGYYCEVFYMSGSSFDISCRNINLDKTLRFTVTV